MKGNSLLDALERVQPEEISEQARRIVEQVEEDEHDPVVLPDGFDTGLRDIRVEAVVSGVLMSLTFDGRKTAPPAIQGILRQWDPEVKVRDSFPSKNWGGQTKTGPVTEITIQNKGHGVAFLEFGLEDGTMIGSRPEQTEEFLKQITGLNVLSPETYGWLEGALKEAGPKRKRVLSLPEQFLMEYSVSDSGYARIQGFRKGE